jgi:UDPglucose 6-dehydrogenase
MENSKEVLKDIHYAKDIDEVAKDADLLIIVTDWNDFKKLDFKKLKSLMNKPNIIDARNLYDSDQLKNLGFNYIGVGR